jgi:hypothetical protein
MISMEDIRRVTISKEGQVFKCGICGNIIIVKRAAAANPCKWSVSENGSKKSNREKITGNKAGSDERIGKGT